MNLANLAYDDLVILENAVTQWLDNTDVDEVVENLNNNDQPERAEAFKATMRRAENLLDQITARRLEMIAGAK